MSSSHISEFSSDCTRTITENHPSMPPPPATQTRPTDSSKSLPAKNRAPPQCSHTEAEDQALRIAKVCCKLAIQLLLIIGAYAALGIGAKTLSATLMGNSNASRDAGIAHDDKIGEGQRAWVQACAQLNADSVRASSITAPSYFKSLLSTDGRLKNDSGLLTFCTGLQLRESFLNATQSQADIFFPFPTTEIPSLDNSWPSLGDVLGLVLCGIIAIAAAACFIQLAVRKIKVIKAETLLPLHIRHSHVHRYRRVRLKTRWLAKKLRRDRETVYSGT